MTEPTRLTEAELERLLEVADFPVLVRYAVELRALVEEVRRHHLACS